jgi:hypothetical protein
VVVGSPRAVIGSTRVVVGSFWAIVGPFCGLRGRPLPPPTAAWQTVAAPRGELGMARRIKENALTSLLLELFPSVSQLAEEVRWCSAEGITPGLAVEVDLEAPLRPLARAFAKGVNKHGAADPFRARLLAIRPGRAAEIDTVLGPMVPSSLKPADPVAGGFLINTSVDVDLTVPTTSSPSPRRTNRRTSRDSVVMGEPFPVFISFARPSGLTHARDLRGALFDLGVRAFVDESGTEPGEDWDNCIRRALNDAAVVVVCLTRATTKSVHQKSEIQRALSRKRKAPLIVPGQRPGAPKRKDWPLGLDNQQDITKSALELGVWIAEKLGFRVGGEVVREEGCADGPVDQGPPGHLDVHPPVGVSGLVAHHGPGATTAVDPTLDPVYQVARKKVVAALESGGADLVGELKVSFKLPAVANTADIADAVLGQGAVEVVRVLAQQRETADSRGLGLLREIACARILWHYAQKPDRAKVAAAIAKEGGPLDGYGFLLAPGMLRAAEARVEAEVVTLSIAGAPEPTERHTLLCRPALDRPEVDTPASGAAETARQLAGEVGKFAKPAIHRNPDIPSLLRSMREELGLGPTDHLGALERDFRGALFEEREELGSPARHLRLIALREEDFGDGPAARVALGKVKERLAHIFPSSGKPDTGPPPLVLIPVSEAEADWSLVRWTRELFKP